MLKITVQTPITAIRRGCGRTCVSETDMRVDYVKNILLITNANKLLAFLFPAVINEWVDELLCCELRNWHR